MTLESPSRSMPSALACLTASANIGSARSQIEIGLILERCTMVASCGSAKLGPSWTSFIWSPEMSIKLIVLRLQRADVEEAILRELVQRDQPFSVRLFGLTHRGVVVAR